MRALNRFDHMLLPYSDPLCLKFDVLKMIKNLVLLTLLVLIILSCTKEPINPNDNNGTSTLSDTTMLNVAYGSHTRQVYDIHLPAYRDTNTPVLLMIHGGAWKAGQKEDFNYYLNLIKSKWTNVAIVNMNYRLASNANNIHHSEIIADINTALNHVNTHRVSYHISDNVGVMGASAGGQLAMIYTYKYNSEIKCVGSIFGPSIINDWSWYNSTNILLGAYMGDILTEYVGQSWDTTAYKEYNLPWNYLQKN
jgi:acetyl esterase/lipase